MSSVPNIKISAVVSSDTELEVIINELIGQAVARHDISVQGAPNEIAERYGIPYVAPEVIQDSRQAPKSEPFMKDDFGWLLGFSFSIPLFIGLVIGIFVIGDVRSISDNFIFGGLGALIGGAIGFALSTTIRNTRKKEVIKQEKKGGFVLWVIVHDEDQVPAVMNILKAHNLADIKVVNATHTSQTNV